MWANRVAPQKILRILFIYLCISILLYFIDDVGFFRVVKQPFHSTTLPVVKNLAHTKLQIDNFFGILGRIPQSAKSEITIERKYNELLATKSQLLTLQQENNQLREQLKLPPKAQRLLSGSLITAKDRMVVVLDTPADVPKGSLVSVGGNLIGEITLRRSPSVYEVLPTAHPNFKALVRVLHGETFVDGIIEGHYSQHLKLSKVLSTAQIGQEDLVILDDEAKVSSERYVLGKITEVKKDETQVFKEATVMPLYDISNIRTVFIEVVQ